MKRIIEIRGAEGGKDAKLFSQDLAKSYIKFIERMSWKYSVLQSNDFVIQIEVVGKSLDGFGNESGGHRIQRVPPTEQKGRVHTSSVTVTVIDPEIEADTNCVDVSDDDFRVEWFSGTGKGGQHRNKKKNSCRLIHIPTGIIETRQGRKREANLREAKESILCKLNNIAEQNWMNIISDIKRDQAGSGMRGDKIRTYRFQDDTVVDHNTGKKARCSKVMKGYFDLLWD